MPDDVTRAAGRLVVGTAGWSVPRAAAPLVPATGSHLGRYSSVFDGVEINSSFYRPHAATTYERWAAATPSLFRFAVKVPKAITHDQALRRPRKRLARFLDETSGLGEKRGPLLVQLPPSLAFDSRVVQRFFACVRDSYEGPLVCEPRHATWFTAAASRALETHRVARVAADPARVPEAAVPGGWNGVTYFRLHGSPRTYWSSYGQAFIADLAPQLVAAAARGDVWCIFDNTASGAAIENAWHVRARAKAARISYP